MLRRDPLGNARRRGPRRHGSLRARAVLSALLTALAAQGVAPAPSALAQDGTATRLLHLPMRWCVLEGTTAARRDPNRAVLERIRRGSSILGPQAGITLRSAINRTLAGELGFPVIPDPRTALGRRGDVQVPTESTGEYRLVVQRCERAWDRLRRQAAPGSDFGGVARGPVAVIIRDFVSRNGQRVSNVWGYAFSASTSGDYCAATRPAVRRASGGSLLVVDSSDGSPNAISDRRLIAHEVGHILRLGHGNGIDDPGSIPGRIDKFCDDTENPDAVPGSLMSASLRYERVTPWQRRLPRTVATRHPSTVEDRPVIRVRPPRTRTNQLQRLAHDHSRIVARLLPPGHAPMTPLRPLLRPGPLGDESPDAIRERFGGRGVPGPADLEAMGLSVDPETGEVDVEQRSRGVPGGAGASEHISAIDGDGDPSTGGSPGEIPGDPAPEWGAMGGIELVTRIESGDGVVTGQAWWWDEVARAWHEVIPPPPVELAAAFGEDDDDAAPNSVVLTVDADLLPGLSDRFRMAGLLRTTTDSGEVLLDTLPPDPEEGGMVEMSLEAADYPVCAVNRDGIAPGVADPGGLATLEAFGFGVDAPVSIYLGDSEEPIASGDYFEIPDDPWPWVAEIELPGDAAEQLHMVQVVLEGTGMTADCPVLLGGGELIDFDA